MSRSSYFSQYLCGEEQGIVYSLCFGEVIIKWYSVFLFHVPNQ